MFSGMYLQADVLGSAMQASALRDTIHAHNIANADVPNFKKYDVVFEPFLQNALEEAKVNGVIDLKKVNFDVLVPEVQKIYKNFEYRIDGNNVDVEAEMAALYQNSVRYEILANGVMGSYQQINTVLSMN